MVKRIHQKYWLLPCVILFSSVCFGQNRVTIPWSASLDITFGEGNINPGAPLPVGSSDFAYTNDPCPPAGSYTVITGQPCSGFALPKRDAGHLFAKGIATPGDTGYMMVVTIPAAASPKIIFADTIKNLCKTTPYIFWAGILNVGDNRCSYPNLTFSVETITGSVIQTFATGDIGGPGDRYTYYPGYFDHVFPPAPPFPYYGGVFSLPTGVNNVVVKIIANPSAASVPGCSNTLAIDNILLMPEAPNVNIAGPGNPDGVITGGCFEGNTPVVLNATLDTSYLEFGTPFKGTVNPVYKTKKYINPQFQWQQSVDGGFTWTDITGQTSKAFSYQFTNPDTFYIRLRTAEASDFSNLNCNITSNVIHIQVDGPPTGYTFSSNSPVCTDGDLVFTFSDGASFITTGPNGFYTNSGKPHISNPVPADSGWYYAEMSTFGGCKVKDSVYVKVMGPDVTISEDTAVCYGKAVQLKAGGGNIYSWLPVAGLSAGNVPNPWAAPLSTTEYEVKVTDQSGCSARASVTVSLRDTVLKAAIAGTDVVCPKDIATFTDTSQGKITSWLWNFGNGQTASGRTPPAQNYPAITNSSKYTVRLFVTDSSGCTDTAFHTIQSVNNCYIAVPNVFTPNNDGSNDYLYPLNAWKAKNLSFTVYNRVGQLIFQTREWTHKWDGTINGNPQPAGVYIWMLRYTDADSGKGIFEKGTAVLIR